MRRRAASTPGWGPGRNRREDTPGIGAGQPAGWVVSGRSCLLVLTTTRSINPSTRRTGTSNIAGRTAPTPSAPPRRPLGPRHRWDRGLVAVYLHGRVVDHPQRAGHLRHRIPERDRLLAGLDPNAAGGEDVEELLHQGSVVAQERGLRDLQCPRQALERLDRRSHVAVLVARESRLGDPGDLLEVRLRVPGLDPGRAKTLPKRALVLHASPPCGCPRRNLTF